MNIQLNDQLFFAFIFTERRAMSLKLLFSIKHSTPFMLCQRKGTFCAKNRLKYWNESFLLRFVAETRHDCARFCFVYSCERKPPKLSNSEDIAYFFVIIMYVCCFLFGFQTSHFK